MPERWGDEAALKLDACTSFKELTDELKRTLNRLAVMATSSDGPSYLRIDELLDYCGTTWPSRSSCRRAGAAGRGGAAMHEGGEASEDGGAGITDGGSGGTGGSASGGQGGSSPVAPCDEASATLLGAMNANVTIPSNVCLKLPLPADQTWIKKVTLQPENGTYPLPYSWSNCTSTGSGAFTANYANQIIMPINLQCPLLVKLAGSGAPVNVQWWGG